MLFKVNVVGFPIEPILALFRSVFTFISKHINVHNFRKTSTMYGCQKINLNLELDLVSLLENTDMENWVDLCHGEVVRMRRHTVSYKSAAETQNG